VNKLGTMGLILNGSEDLKRKVLRTRQRQMASYGCPS